MDATDAPPTAARLSGVGTGTLLGLGAAAIVAVYAPVVAGMAAEWAQFARLSHGFAIPLIAAYLIWGRRGEIARASVASSPLGLVPLVLGLATLVVGSLGGESFLARLSLPFALLGAVLFLAGLDVARRVWVGIAYLLFMIPLPFVMMKALTYRSQLFDATVTAEVLKWLGLPLLRDGILLHLPSITLEVGPDCSSVPAIAALGALGAAYAQMKPRPAWVRLVLLLAAVPLGLGSNLVRILLTVSGAYLIGPVVLENILHKFAGTTVFLATLVLLVALDALLLRLALIAARTSRRARA